MLRELFRAMANRNGRFGTAAIPWSMAACSMTTTFCRLASVPSGIW